MRAVVGHDACERPTLPPLFICALAFWAACAGTIMESRFLDAQTCCLALIVSGALGCGAVALSAVRARRLAALLAGSVAVGCAVGLSHGMALHAANEAASVQWIPRAEAFILSDATPAGEAVTCPARIADGAGYSFTVQLVAPRGCESLRYGERVSVAGRFVPADYTRGPYEWTRGFRGALKVERASPLPSEGVLSRLAEFRTRALGALCEDESESGSLVAALSCGSRSGLIESDVYDQFKTSGIAHLVAVSGAHLAIVAASVASVARKVGLGRRHQALLIAGVVSAYLVMSGAPVSAVRAAVMAGVALAAPLARRRPSGLAAVGACVFAFLGIDPSSAVSASFALSALSTSGILLFGRIFTRWLSHAAPFLPDVVIDPLALTMAASFCSLPYSAAAFSQLSLIAPVSNVAVAPLFAPACLIALVDALAAALIGGLAGPLHMLACAPSLVVCRIADALSHVPFACVPVDFDVASALALTLLSALAVWVMWSRNAALVACTCALLPAALLFACACFSLNASEIDMLDVGQGDAILVRSEGATMLVDTGRNDALLARALARHGVTHLDAVVITHADDDHCGSLDVLARLASVDCVLVADGMLASKNAECTALVDKARAVAPAVHGLQWGDRLSIGSFTATVVWPQSFSHEGGNADSICLYLDCDADADAKPECTALLTGDAEAPQVKQAIASAGIGQVDIFKAGHHGARKGVDDTLAQTLSPQVSLVSVGARNRYGHPAPEAVAALEGAGACVLRTDEAGDVSCRIEHDAVRVVTQR